MVKISKFLWSIVLMAVTFGLILGLMGYLYWNLNNRHNELQKKYFIVESDYRALNETHKAWVAFFNQLNTSYQILSLNHTMLKEEYENLNTEHQSLFNNYNSLLEASNEPLSYEEIPTTSELRTWLASDETDEIWYDFPNFICGDFAVMLSQHAKLEHWDMGIVAVFGHDENYESYAHAFNVIITVEGLVYVEPQNDHVWWYSGHEAIYEEAWFEVDNEFVYIDEYVTIVSYD